MEDASQLIHLKIVAKYLKTKKTTTIRFIVKLMRRKRKRMMKKKSNSHNINKWNGMEPLLYYFDEDIYDRYRRGEVTSCGRWWRGTGWMDGSERRGGGRGGVGAW